MKKIALSLLLLVGCGSAEAAKTPKSIEVKVAIVGDAIGWCELSAAWRIAIERIHRDLQTRVPINMEYDLAAELTRPDLLTVEAFWKYWLWDWLHASIPRANGTVRLVLTPPLAGGLTGGMTERRCQPKRGFAFANVVPGQVYRSALVIGHELAHVIGAADRCDPSRKLPSIMCAQDAPALKTDPNASYDWAARRQVRKCLMLNKNRRLPRRNERSEGF